MNTSSYKILNVLVKLSLIDEIICQIGTWNDQYEDERCNAISDSFLLKPHLEILRDDNVNI